MRKCFAVMTLLLLNVPLGLVLAQQNSAAQLPIVPLIDEEQQFQRQQSNYFQGQLPNFILTPVRPGQFDINVAPDYNQHNLFTSSNIRTSMVYGLSRRVQIGGFIGALRYRRFKAGTLGRQLGFGNVGMGAEYTIPARPENHMLQKSFEGNIVIPTGEVGKGLSAGLLVYEPEFVLSRRGVGGNNDFFIETGVELYTRLAAPPPPIPTPSAATQMDVKFGWAHFTDKWVSKIEYIARSNRWLAKGDYTVAYFSPSIFWHSHRIQYGLDSIFGLSKQSINYGIEAVIVYQVAFGEQPGPQAGVLRGGRRR